jgi:hypothetical protein
MISAALAASRSWIACMSWRCFPAPEPGRAEDVAEPLDLGSAFNDLSVWRCHVAKARSRGM